MSRFKVVQVGSHTANVAFGGANVPLGFLASHRKRKHGDCEGGGGFLVKSMPGSDKKTYLVCPCATDRAQKKLRQVGIPGFQSLAAEWLAAEQIKIAESEQKCRGEGRAAPDGATCPYPKDTDQALAWAEGHAERASAS